MPWRATAFLFRSPLAPLFKLLTQGSPIKKGVYTLEIVVDSDSPRSLGDNVILIALKQGDGGKSTLKPEAAGGGR